MTRTVDRSISPVRNPDKKKLPDTTQVGRINLQPIKKTVYKKSWVLHPEYILYMN